MLLHSNVFIVANAMIVKERSEHRLVSLMAEMRSVSEQERRLQEEIAELSGQRQFTQEQLTHATRDLGSLRDSKTIFKNKVMQDSNMSRSGLQTLDWIDQNRDKFQKEVYGPIGMHIQVNDPACAAMLENHIPLQTLTSAFLVQSEHDASVLRQFRSSKNLVVDIITIDSELPPSQFSRQQLQGLTRIGIQGFLSEQGKTPNRIFYFFAIINSMARYFT